MSTLSASSATLSPILSSPISVLKKQKMSITQTYYLAHKARAKLSREASMPDHNLRLLVGHANLLDSLMLELADAEREQESWFNQSVRSASHSERKEDRHIQWADTIAEEDEEEYDEDEESSSEDEEDDSDLSDEDVEMLDAMPLQRVVSHNSTNIISQHKLPATPKTEVIEIDMDDFEEDDDYEDEDYAELTLTRSPSHHSITASSPPELEHDSDDLSEDDAMPPSPPSTMLPTFEERQKESGAIAHATDFYDETIEHYMPAARNSARLVSAISVY